MNSLQQLKAQQELRGETKRSPEYQWTQAELNDAWRRVTTPVLGLAEILANSRTLEDVKGFQDVGWGEFAELPPEEVLEFAQQMRDAWSELEALASENKKIVRGSILRRLNKWWEEYPLTSAAHWNVYYQTGTFFPTQKNFRAMFARVCFDNRDYLGICQNPSCGRCFVKPRRISKFCKNCHAYDSRNRVKKHREKLSAQKSRKRVSK